MNNTITDVRCCNYKITIHVIFDWYSILSPKKNSSLDQLSPWQSGRLRKATSIKRQIPENKVAILSAAAYLTICQLCSACTNSPVVLTRVSLFLLLLNLVSHTSKFVLDKRFYLIHVCITPCQEHCILNPMIRRLRSWSRYEKQRQEKKI